LLRRVEIMTAVGYTNAGNTDERPSEFMSLYFGAPGAWY
jgi:hypothetical protein